MRLCFPYAAATATATDTLCALMCVYVKCRRVFTLLARLGLGDEPITMRMTGCPNGCARPYMAEIGFVGDGPNSYQVSVEVESIPLTAL